MGRQTQNIRYGVVCCMVMLFVSVPLFAQSNVAVSSDFEVNYDVLEETAVKQYYFVPKVRKKSQKKTVSSSISDKNKLHRIGPLLTAPDGVNIKTIGAKPLLTAPFVHMDPVAASSRPKEKIWTHGLPSRKPDNINIRKTIARLLLPIFRTSIPYPARKPLHMAKNIKLPIAIPIKRAPVVPVIAEGLEELPVPEIPTRLQSFEGASEQGRQAGKESISFEGDNSVITEQMEIVLHDILKTLDVHKGMRVQLHAFATGENGNPSSARRISLARALSVREYLKKNGIRPTRMDVRALGDQTTRQPVDRIDFVFVR